MFHFNIANRFKVIFSTATLVVGMYYHGAVLAVPADDFMEAREAFRLNDVFRLNNVAARLNGTVFEPYAAYWQLQSRLKDTPPVEIREFLKKYADGPIADRARADWLRLLGKQQNWELFLTEYPALITGDAELTCYALHARLLKNDTNASTELRRLWLNALDLPDNCTPAFDMLISNGVIKQEDIWSRIRIALEAGNVSVAKQAALYLYQTLSVEKFTAENIAENPQRFLDKYKGNLESRVDRELLMFALYRISRTQPPLALAYWQNWQKSFTELEQKYVWGQLALHAARKQDPLALAWYKETEGYPLTDLQLSWKARAALRAQDWSNVLSAIDAMSEKEQTQAVWRYWKARALKIQGKPFQANSIFAPLSLETGYYGQLALEELGVVMSAPEHLYLPTEEEVAAIARIAGIDRAIALYKVNARSDANKEWSWATRNFDDKQLLAAAELAQRHEWYDRSIYTAGRTAQLQNLALRFPAPHRTIMQEHARQWQLDEAWVYGLIRQESRFVTQARSSVGASGLMQVMPATAQWIAKRLGLRNFRQALLNQIETNISFGTYYLKYVLDTNEGQPVLATAAYNAGPTRAKRWRAERPMEGAIYAESIPFTETRDYVQKVMSNASFYASRFGQQIVSLKRRLGVIPGRNPKDEGEIDSKAPDELPESPLLQPTTNNDTK